MNLSPTQKDRAAGVLLGQAIGDALGVPYEFAPRITPGTARMIGGGLGPYAPGEWSDDTQMAICIAEVAASGLDLTTDAALQRVAERFLQWRTSGATDVGNQINAVLTSTLRHHGPTLMLMRRLAKEQAVHDKAGNGALMRTGIVGITALDDRNRTALATRRVAELTHAHELCVESSILWSEAIRRAVVDGELNLRAGIDLVAPERLSFWSNTILEAEQFLPERFAKNGFTLTALQAAWSAIHHTRHLEGTPDHVEAALQLAISIGYDTDTVAAIAGALLGARYGVSGLPTDLARRVHGWPGLTGRDLVALASTIAAGRAPTEFRGRSMLTGTERPIAASHPHDPGVWLGTMADLSRCRELDVTAVVSLCRVGEPDIVATGVAPHKHVSVRLIDSEDPTANAHLAWTLTDAARTIATLRAEGERVLVHCVHAHHRTPAVALAYARLRGVDADEAASAIEAALEHPVDGLLWRTARSLP